MTKPNSGNENFIFISTNERFQIQRSKLFEKLSSSKPSYKIKTFISSNTQT